MPDVVPFPRTVPEDAPGPPAPLLDQRAARSLFSARRRENGAIGYRLAAEGVYVQHLGGDEAFFPWADVVAFAREVLGHRDYAEDDDDPSRRERRQQRRQERRDRRRQGLERGDDS